MSLIPYHPPDGRDIVLRHQDAVVVRDPTSRRLEIKRLTECPTCHQSLRPVFHEEPSFSSASEDSPSYVDPNYFRMLRADDHSEDLSQPPSSPIRRLVEPYRQVQNGDLPPHTSHAQAQEDVYGEAFKAAQAGKPIHREYFLPNYFKTFFRNEKVLGQGGKGVVLLVRHELNGHHLGYYACKRIPVGDNQLWLEKVLEEVKMLAAFSHPNLVSYRHVWLEDVQLNRFGPSVACAYILQKYCNSGDLLTYVAGPPPKEATKEQLKAQMRRRSSSQAERPDIGPSPHRRLHLDEIYLLFKDITAGLAYLHGQSYVHRDLKPSNCLLHKEDGKLTCLISDFGETQPEHVMRKSTGYTGTISFCAPEVLCRDSTGDYANFTTKSDIFSLGMVLYFMCFGRLPYHAANTLQEELEDVDELKAEITGWQGFKDEKKQRPDLPTKLYQLLKKLLAVNPDDRPTAQEVLAALKSKSSLDSAWRGVSGVIPPSLSLSARRMQDLDSQPESGAPIPDPTKRSSTLPASPDESPADSPATVLSSESIDLSHSNSLQRIPSPRLRATAMTLTRSRSSKSRPSQSPFRSKSPQRLDSIHERRRSSHERLLLMPPPATGLSALLSRGKAITQRLSEAARGHGLESTSIVRLALFLAKIASLYHCCWPYSVKVNIGGPLLLAAALDLIITRTSSSGRAFPTIVETDDPVAPKVNDVRQPRGIQSSVILALAHAAVLWLMGTQGLLCPAHHGPWGD